MKAFNDHTALCVNMSVLQRCIFLAVIGIGLSAMPQIAFGSTQIFMTRTSGTGITATTQMVINSAVNTNSAATSTAGSLRPGTISNLYAYVLKPPTAGTTWTATVMQEGVATAVTCTIDSSSPTNASGAAYCSDITHSVTTTSDAAITVQMVPVSSPPRSGAYASFQFSPATPNENSIPISTNSASTNGFNGFGGFERMRGLNTIATNVQTYFPESTTVKNLHIATTASVAPGSYIYTATKNFINDALTCTSSATFCDDNTHTVTYGAGDVGNIFFTTSGSPTNGAFGGHVVMVPATAGSFYTMFGNIGDFVGATPSYFGPTTGGNTNEASSSIFTDQLCVTAFTATTSTAVGAGNTRTFAVRQGVNGGAMATSSANCSISGAAGAGANIYNCMWTGQLQFAQGDLLDVADDTHGAGTAGQPNFLIEATPGACATAAPSRRFRLFEGFIIKLISGTLKLIGQ
jgi:hypothetical protein